MYEFKIKPKGVEVNPKVTEVGVVICLFILFILFIYLFIIPYGTSF